MDKTRKFSDSLSYLRFFRCDSSKFFRLPQNNFKIHFLDVEDTTHFLGMSDNLFWYGGINVTDEWTWTDRSQFSFENWDGKYFIK